MSALPKWEAWLETRARVDKWGKVTISREPRCPERCIIAAEWFDDVAMTTNYDVMTACVSLRQAKVRGLLMVTALREKAERARGGARRKRQ